MSRVIQNVASVRYELNVRPASASMQALQGEARKLEVAIEDANKEKAKLGDVPDSDPEFQRISRNLKNLNSDLKDVKKTISDLTRGVKAADQLLAAAETGRIEDLSMKAITSGINGLRKRIGNIKPETASPEEMKVYEIVTKVIKEAELVMDRFKATAVGTLQTLRDGGTVSEKAMTQTRDAFKNLMQSTEEGTKENREYTESYEFLAAKVNEFTEAQRRAKGEIVDANDARRAAVRLTREGAEAARQEVQAQDALIAQKKEEIRQNEELRQQQQQNIDQTQQQIKANQQEEDSIRAKIRTAEEESFYIGKNGELVRNDIHGRVNALEKEKDATRQTAEQQQAAAQVAQNAANQKREAFEQTTQAVDQLDAEVKQLQEDLRKMNEEDDISRNQGYYDQAINDLKAMGVAEQDITDQAKIQEAIEKKTLEIMQAEVEAEKEAAEQRKKLTSKITSSQLGGTKADQEFYAKNRGNYNVEDYDHVDDVMERIAHLEMVSKLKNGRKFSDDTYWDPDDELDEDEAHVMNDKEKQAALDELRFLKQHIREELLKAFREVGDFDKAIEQVTGGDGVSEDAKFGEQLNDKLQTIREKIEDKIETTLDKYSDIVDQEYQSAYDDNGKLVKEKVRRNVKDYIEGSIQEASGSKANIDESRQTIKEYDQDIVRLTGDIENYGKATDQSAASDEEKAKKQELLSQKEDELAKKKTLQTQQEKEYQQAQAEADSKQQQANDTQAKAISLQEQHTQATNEANAADKEREQRLGELDQKANKLNADNEQLTATLQQQQQQQQATDRAIADGNQTILDAEKKKAQARELSAKDMRDAIAALQQENDAIGESNPKWAENNRLIGQYSQRLEEMKQKSAELRGEIMSLDEALAMSKNLDEGASVEQMEQAVKTLTEARRKAVDTEKFDEYGVALDKISAKLKEQTSEWMTLAQAREIAEQAGKNYYNSGESEGFTASPEEIQKATAALERQREALIKSIKAKRDNKNATEEEKAALKKQEDELQDLTKKLKDLKFEQDNFNMSQAKMQMLMKQPTEAVNLDELRAAIKRADGELKRMEGSMGKNSKEYKNFAEQVKAAKNQLKEMEGQAKATSSAWDKAWSRLKTYVGMYMGFNALWNKITGTFSDIHELSDRMGEVRKTTGFTADEVGRLSDNLAKLDTRTNLTGLMELSATAGQLGLKSQEDIQGFTEAANKLIVAMPELGREAAQNMMRVAIATGEVDKIRKQMEEGTISGSSATAVAMEKIASTIDRLRATSAATAPEITDFVKRLGAVGAQSGITIDEVAALGSTVSSLGMRVEMSATALSRMIPAIKRNAFELAKALGMAPNALRAMFDEADGGMNAMLAIFQHMKDQGMDANNIEKMLGMGGMTEIMKDLNQQGARAGIVFAGLSQNVDVLRQHLGVARQAYEENIAIQNEYDKMNETTAAKWERLKNEVEEAFVSDSMQNFLGNIIDGLRTIVDLITGPLNGAVAGAAVGFAAYKAGIGDLVKNLKDLASGEDEASGGWEEFVENLKNKDWISIATSAVIGLGTALYVYIDSLMESAREAARYEAELMKEQMKVDSLTESIGKSRVSQEEATKEVEKAQKALEEAKKATDGSRESTEKLTKAEKDLMSAEEKKQNIMAESKRLIEQFNSEYGKYLGFMLSEVASNIELAQARELVNDKLRETITLKRKEAALTRVEESMGEDRDAAYAELWDFVQRKSTSKDKNGKEITDPTKAAKVLNEITRAAQRGNLDEKAFEETVKGIFKTYDIKNYDVLLKRAKDYYGELDAIREKSNLVEKQFATEEKVNRENSQKNLERQYKAATANYDKLQTEYEKSTGKARKQAAANLLKQMDSIQEMVDHSGSYFKMEDKQEEKDYKAFVKNGDARLKGMQEQREALLKEAGNAYTKRKTVDGDYTETLGDNNPWGSKQPAESTDWKNMTAEQLVNRRKQMKDFVNSIQTDTDVKAVLEEDAALKKAIEKGMSSDMRTVIEWYNTERLKIQDELHARHLTNTGDWMDPKKQKGAHKQFQNEMQAYLDEIDAYYTERKAKIQEAQNDEQISEAEAKNRTLANDAEWRQRRAELQQLYAEKSAKVTQAEQDAIYNIISERTGDSESFVKAMIQKTIGFAKQIEASGEKGAAVVHKWRSKLDKDIEQDFLRQRNAIGQHMKAIQDIIDKERPFNGITKNLQDNLTTMGILAGHMQKELDELNRKGEDTTDFNNRQTAEKFRELTFLLGESEHAYATTIEEVMKRASDEGLTAWVEYMRQNPKAQEGMMAQLRSTYDAVQDAIKKEASQMKKQAEIMWNNILLPGGDGKTTIKDALEKTISQLGIEQGRVLRANSLIGAGQASERVADKLAIKQMQLQLTMQQHYYNLMQRQGQQRVKMLDDQAKKLKQEYETLKAMGEESKAQQKMDEYKAKMLDKQHAEMSLNLATTKEQTELAKQQEEIIARTEESQARLYKELREWGDLLASSLQSVFEASNAGNAEYYNELAKLNLTGKGGPGAGTYIVIDNEGTEDAKAHYEYLDERAALERQREIEQQNAVADAWKKVMDDVNQKLSDTITDQLNALFQNASLDANTQAILANTKAIYDSMGVAGGTGDTITRNAEGFAVDESGQVISPIQPTAPTEQPAEGMPKAPWQMTDDELAKNQENIGTLWTAYKEYGIAAEMEKAEALAEIPGFVPSPLAITDEQIEATGEKLKALGQQEIEQDTATTQAKLANQQLVKKGEQQTDQQMVKTNKASFAAMTAAANMYGIAYQTMSNDNLDTSQKVQMMIVQAAGSAAISMLTASLAASQGETAANAPSWISKTLKELGPIGGPVAVGVFTALLGGLMGLAVSKIGKSKSQIAQVTGASVGAGRLSTGMLTYAEGNVNEFTDPGSLTPGRSYNVDAADGKTYRARYMGANPKTHLTNGPEFHLVGEKGREAIIDAHTTRLLQTDDTGIWKSIQMLYNGGSLRHASVRRGRGVRAFASGNLDEIENLVGSDGIAADGAGFGGEQMAAFQSSLDRNNELLERALTDGIHARFDVYGKGGLIDSYDTGKKTVNRHGERY